MVTTTQTGLIGMLCEVNDEPVSFDDCLACAQKGAPGCPMIPAIVERIRDGIRPQDYAQSIAEENGADFGISVTELIYCSRQYHLQRMYPYREHPRSLYRMMRGSGVHADLASYSQGIREATLSWKFQYSGTKVMLIGTPDLIEVRPEGWFITDYKVTGNPPRRRWVYLCLGCNAECRKENRTFHCPNCGPLKRSGVDRMALPPEPRDGHIWQINLYSLLVEKNAEKLAIDHNLEDPGDVSGGQVAYLPHDVPVRCPVIYDRAATLEFIKFRLRELLSTELPAPLIGGWQCDFCTVRSHCEDLYCGPVGKAALEDAAD